MGFTKLYLQPPHVKELNRILNKYHINSKIRVRHFLAQSIIETIYGTEFLETSYEDNKKGYTGKASYHPFYGAGIIQLTWASGYQGFQNYAKQALGITDSTITYPSYSASPYVANTYPYESAGWFWDVYSKLNEEVDRLSQTETAIEAVRKITKKVKGADTKYEERYDAFVKIAAVLK